jgi:ring-1,2-phenylacetyl-CoA epoxidase subunit PaaD
MSSLTVEAVWRALEDVKDPEIPVISVVELGVVRDVSLTKDGVVVTITPTFSGCPALDVMQEDIRACLQGIGVEDVTVETQLNPPWTTDWIDDKAREKLRQFGLAPPPYIGSNIEFVLEMQATCPFCGSTDTVMKNAWGPTACRMIYVCESCRQPFEQFKPI